VRVGSLEGKDAEDNPASDRLIGAKGLNNPGNKGSLR
jgi:hypothetical protein